MLGLVVDRLQLSLVSCFLLGGSPLRPSLIDALQDALGCNDRVIDRGLIGRRSRLGWYLCQLARGQNRGGDEQYALAPFVHPGILYLSPDVRLGLQQFLDSLLSLHMQPLPVSGRSKSTQHPIGGNDDCLLADLRNNHEAGLWLLARGAR